MKNPKIIIGAVLLLMAAGMASCKKTSSDPLGSSVILFINMTSSFGDGMHYRIVYGAGNNVDSIIGTGGGSDTGTNTLLTFSYLNSSYIITDNNNKQTTVHLNSSVQIDSIFFSAVAPAPAAYDYIQYNGTQVGALNDEAPTSAYPYYTLTTYDYYYTNNNITAINITGGVSETFTYNTGLKGQLGDPLRVFEFLQYGRSISASANLVTERDVNNTWTEKYSYQTDGNGRITLMTRVLNNAPSVNDTLRYAYTYNF